jgi:hypothetical protein
MAATRIDSAVTKKWLQFRYARMKELFRARLAAAGLTDSAIEVALAALFTSRPQRARPAPSRRVDHLSDLRSLFQTIIDQLDDDALRRIEVPFGVVFDIVTKGRG